MNSSPENLDSLKPYEEHSFKRELQLTQFSLIKVHVSTQIGTSVNSIAKTLRRR